MRQSVRHHEDAVRELERKRQEGNTLSGEIRVRLSESEIRIENYRRDVHEKYDLDLEQAVAVREVDERDDESLEKEAEILRQKMNRIGPVDIVAIEEYRQLQERHDHLVNQEDDLVRSRDSLKRTIQKVNRESRAYFEDAFRKIRENFRDMFRKLFGGGQADMVLVDPSDPLNSGIDIFAHPPGKAMTEIASLSGGERAKTALAVLFGVFMFKPSPFCVLDELDAPLDEINVDRFVRVLRSFADKTQFIVVTHNKRTMEAVDALYGVTMQEPGVSKVVGVKFRAGDQVETSLEESDEGVPPELLKRASKPKSAPKQKKTADLRDDAASSSDNDIEKTDDDKNDSTVEESASAENMKPVQREKNEPGKETGDEENAVTVEEESASANAAGVVKE